MFTPVQSFVGGILLFQASQGLYILRGKVLGCSGILRNILEPTHGFPVVLGFTAGTWLLSYLAPKLVLPSDSVLAEKELSHLYTCAAGLLVGLGTKLANGCTSGHMLIGIARLSKRSLVASMTFFATAVCTCWLLDTAPVNNLPSMSLYSRSVIDYDATVLLLPVLTLLGFALIAQTRYGLLASFYSGAVFAMGLLVSGMYQSAKTLGFLNVFRPASWDPSLLMIVLGGLIPNLIVFNTYAKSLDQPKVDGHFSSPNNTIDTKLIIGSAIFGTGWGLSGICPGPAMVDLLHYRRFTKSSICDVVLGWQLLVKSNAIVIFMIGCNLSACFMTYALLE